MKQLFSLGLGLLLLGVGHGVVTLQAQEAMGQAQVHGILGNATAMGVDGKITPLKSKMVLVPGTTIKTGPRAAVDLFLGKSAGIIRLTENSILVLKQYKLMDAGGQTIIELELNLDQGSLLGKEGHINTSSSHYEIKIPTGIAGIDGGTFRINAQGYIVLTEGSLAYVHVDAAGQPKAYKLHAPPATYFSPVEGVKPAPEALTREVNFQLKSKLK
ncbi:MAG: hypothetical protein JWM16_1053 [Verrucomicrobiales bacterium]|nr:hypothetical protein [Verrucomicrobiales bacterium]